MDINQLIPIASAVSTFALIGFLAFRESRSGSHEITREVITNYKTLDEQQKANIQECRDNLVGATKSMHELELRTNERIANLEGVVSEKDKQLQTLNSIVSNRSPELENTLHDIRNFMKNINDYFAVEAQKKHK